MFIQNSCKKKTGDMFSYNSKNITKTIIFLKRILETLYSYANASKYNQWFNEQESRGA